MRRGRLPRRRRGARRAPRPRTGSSQIRRAAGPCNCGRTIRCPLPARRPAHRGRGSAASAGSGCRSRSCPRTA
eukprot:2537458-Prymnesium_polylepis.1